MFEGNFALHINTYKGIGLSMKILVHIYYRIFYNSYFQLFLSAGMLLKICIAHTPKTKHSLAINNHYDYTERLELTIRPASICS